MEAERGMGAALDLVDQVLDWFSAIDVGHWLAAGGIVIGAAVALYIARAQGVFRKPVLSTRFSPPGDAEPAVVVFNIKRAERRKQVVSIFFFLQNLGRVPATGITMQFGLYPRREIADLMDHFGPMYERSFPGAAHVTAVDNRDLIELKVATLAPDEGYVISLPWLILPDQNRSEEPDGLVTLDLHYGEGRRIRKAMYVCVGSGIEAKDDNERRRTLNPILEQLVEGEGPLRMSLFDIAYNALFRIPVVRVPWLVTEVHTTPVGKSLAVQTELIGKTEPTIYQGMFEKHIGGPLKWKALLFLFGPLLVLGLIAGIVEIARRWQDWWPWLHSLWQSIGA